MVEDGGVVLDDGGFEGGVVDGLFVVVEEVDFGGGGIGGGAEEFPLVVLVDEVDGAVDEGAELGL